MSKVIRTVYHPGVYLKDYIEEKNLTIEEFALKLGVSTIEVKLILYEKENITTEIGDKLSKYIGTSPEFWIKLQNKYNAYIESRNNH